VDVSEFVKVALSRIIDGVTAAQVLANERGETSIPQMFSTSAMASGTGTMAAESSTFSSTVRLPRQMAQPRQAASVSSSERSIWVPKEATMRRRSPRLL
jgi:hypothetical protein